MNDLYGKTLQRIGTFYCLNELHQTHEDLQAKLRRHESLMTMTSVIMWHSTADQSSYAVQGWTEFTGSPSNPTIEDWIEAIHLDDQARIVEARAAGLSAGKPYLNEYRLRHIDGNWRWVSEAVAALQGNDGTLEGWVGVVSDIDDRRRAEQALRASEQRLRLAIEATGLATWDIDYVSGHREWSPEFRALLHVEAAEQPCHRLFLSRVHPEDRPKLAEHISRVLSVDACTQHAVFRLKFETGEERWIEASERTFFDSDGRPLRRAGAMQDITVRKQAERKIWHAAHTDALTGLANRTLFQSRLDRALAKADAGDLSVGLLIIDLDRFKNINDTLGHDAGDAVLRAVAERLTAAGPANATVARLGGDEFAIVLPLERGGECFEGLVADLLSVLRAPVIYAGRELDCSASLGWSLYPQHDAKASSLLKNTDIALFAAKAAGRGRSAMFVPAMRDALEHHITVLRRAKDALLRDAVMPFYQPKVSLRTGHVVGFEALLRWTEDGQVHPPAALQDAFADPELAVLLGARMLERVAADMRVWSDAGVPFGHVALNVAAPEFREPGFAARILDTLATARLRTDQLEIEVTEGVLLDNETAAVATALRTLHTAGISVALDDFGTGYASLTHLKAFPVSWLKIDRSFVGGMERNRDTAAIVRAVVGLARNIGIGVVAEGIETVAQRNKLAQMRCDVGQGYLFAKPMDRFALPDYLNGWSAKMSNFKIRRSGSKSISVVNSQYDRPHRVVQCEF